MAEDEVLIFGGSTLTELTCGLYPALPHRVVRSVGTQRFSAPFFLRADFATTLRKRAERDHAARCCIQ